jgi:hypothetical protein
MAKGRKRAKRFRVAGAVVPKRWLWALVSAARTPLGKVILAEALIQGAALLATRHPTAAGAAAGAGAATAAKDVASSARHAGARFLHATAHALKSGVMGSSLDAGKHEAAQPDRAPHSDGEEYQGHHPSGNGTGHLWDRLDPDLIREAVIGELARKKKAKKPKRAKRH